MEADDLPSDGPGAARPSAPVLLGTRPAVITGGVSGSALATFAQTLREPYRTYVTLLAPAVTAVITSYWPRILTGINRLYRDYQDVRRDRAAVRALRIFIVELERSLEDPKFPREMKAEIRENIRKAQRAIIRISYRAISRHVDDKA